MTANYHTHTWRCNHASGTEREYIEKAIESGIRILGFSVPEYSHIPLLMDSEGRRLAKRDKDLSLDELLKRYTPEDILGMLAFACGVLPEWRRATLDELVRIFDWKNVKREDMRLPKDLTSPACRRT